LNRKGAEGSQGAAREERDEVMTVDKKQGEKLRAELKL
jgi:hypothetical protein